MRPTHEHILQSKRRRNTESLTNICLVYFENSLFVAQRKNLAHTRSEIKIHPGSNNHRRKRSQSRTNHSPITYIYKDVIENHIKHTHHDTCCARHAHIPATLQSIRRKIRNLHERQSQRKYHEIKRRIAPNVLAATQPYRKWKCNSQRNHRNRCSECTSGNQTVCKHSPGTLIVFCAHLVRHLNGITKTHGTCKAAKKPRSSFHQSNTRRSLCTKVSHHGGINVKHKHTRYLSQNRGHTECHNQFQFVHTRQFSTITHCR